MMPRFCHTFLIHPFPIFCLTEEPQDEAIKLSKRKKKKKHHHSSPKSLLALLVEFCLLLLTFLISCFHPTEETWKVGLSLFAFLP